MRYTLPRRLFRIEPSAIAIPPRMSEPAPTSGPIMLMPVNGNEPGLSSGPALGPPAAVTGVFPLVGDCDIVVGGATVDPCEATELDVVLPAVVGVGIDVEVLSPIVVGGATVEPSVPTKVDVVSPAVVGVSTVVGCLDGRRRRDRRRWGDRRGGRRRVPGVVLVLVGGAVVVVVDPFEPTHVSMSVTDVLPVRLTPSVHVAITVSWMLPVTLPGTIVVAEVEPLGARVLLYPVTANVCAPLAATADVIVRPRLASLLPIDHVMT